MSHMDHPAQSPVSFRAHVLRLPKKGMPVVIDATEAQRKALAAQHGLLSVERFRAEMLVEAWNHHGVRVSGRIDADIVQACVLTLDPVPATIAEPFDALFVPEGSKLGRNALTAEGEIHLDAEGPDSPETFDGDSIDVGALAEEYFGLAIDPYPRARGAGLDDAGVAVAEPEADVPDWKRKLRSLGPKP